MSKNNSNICFSRGFLYDTEMVEKGIVFIDPAGTRTLIKFNEIYAIRRTRLGRIATTKSSSGCEFAVISVTLVYNFTVYYKVRAKNDLNIKMCQQKLDPHITFYTNGYEIKIGKLEIDMKKIDDILYDGTTIKIRLVGYPSYGFIAKCSEAEIDAIQFVMINSRHRKNVQCAESSMVPCVSAFGFAM